MNPEIEENPSELPSRSDPEDWDEITQPWPADPLLLEACKLRARTTTKMRAVQWPPK